MKFYNSTADRYDKRHDNATTKHLRKRELKVLKKYARGLVLDVGCGTGEYAGIVKEYVGIDSSVKMILEARKKNPGHFLTASAESLPFSENSFDTVICMFTVLNLCDAKKAAKEMSRVLKAGGCLVLSAASVWDKKNYRFLQKVKGKSDSDVKSVRIDNEKLRFMLFRHKDLAKLFESKGLKMIENHGIFKIQEPYWNKYKEFGLIGKIKLEIERLLPPGSGRIYIMAFRKAA